MSRVTVGMPVFNGQRFLSEAIESVRSQSLPDLELIISDNASTDDTRQICQEYAELDPRIRYARTDLNNGAAWNFNHLARRAATPYFMWHAADDVADRTYLERCVAQLEADPRVVLAYTEAGTIDEDGHERTSGSKRLDFTRSQARDRFRQCLAPFSYSENVIYGVIRTEALRKTRLLGKFGGSDRAFLAELSLYGTFSRIDRRLFHRRQVMTATNESQVQQYNAGRRVTFPLREWRILQWNLGSVRRAPLPLRDRARLVSTIGHRLVQERALYAAELKQAMMQLIVSRGPVRKQS